MAQLIKRLCKRLRGTEEVCWDEENKLVYDWSNEEHLLRVK